MSTVSVPRMIHGTHTSPPPLSPLSYDSPHGAHASPHSPHSHDSPHCDSVHALPKIKESFLTAPVGSVSCQGFPPVPDRCCLTGDIFPPIAETLLSAFSLVSSKKEVCYDSGAVFSGNIENYKKCGRGIFRWPNGSYYEGEFYDNKRSGQGQQIWHDGSLYVGEFRDDMRHGQGSIKWKNGESYEGPYFRDYRHGYGVYTWPDGSSYHGYLYMDQREGYGTFNFANGIVFQGLYKGDSRYGPGVQTYPDGSEDVGIWHGEKLIKFCTQIENGFDLANHVEMDLEENREILYLDQYRSDVKPHNSETSLLRENNIIFYTSGSERHKTQLFTDNVDRRCVSLNRVAFDREFFKDYQSITELSVHAVRSDCSSIISSEPERQLIWNKTPAMVKTQQHVHRHENGRRHLKVDIDAILNNERDKFGPIGVLEQKCGELLHLAMDGKMYAVDILLATDLVDPDVTDCDGTTPLLCATVNWHMDVITCLLSHGADINKLTDQGCSALTAGFTLYFPPSCLKFEPEVSIHSANSTAPRTPVSNSKRSSKYNSTEDLNKNAVDGPELVRFDDVEHEHTTAVTTNHVSKDTKNDINDKINQISQDINNNAITRTKMDSRDSTVRFEDGNSSSRYSDFESNRSVRNYKIDVSSRLIDRSATQLSTNVRALRNVPSTAATEATRELARQKALKQRQKDILDLLIRRGADPNASNTPMPVLFFAINEWRFFTFFKQKQRQKDTLDLLIRRGADPNTSNTPMPVLFFAINEKQRQKDTLDLLIRRGADPNASNIPMPVLFFAIKAADVEMVRHLLMKGASPTVQLTHMKGNFSPLHIAVSIEGEGGIKIAELLLDALADPDARAAEDDSYLNVEPDVDWTKDVISDELQMLLGGRTPLHVVCARDDNHKDAYKIAKLLLRHKASKSVVCNGHSPLALAITSGNDMIIDELLAYDADPAQPLTHGIGNALCVIFSTQYENRWPIEQRLQIIDKLVKAGANILDMVPMGPKRTPGTAVDYAYYIYNLDRRIAHMPYHALSKAEREIFNSRRQLLNHIGGILRTKALERERESGEFLVPEVTFSGSTVCRPGQSKTVVQRPGLRYCYECGRSNFVRLAPCTRCKRVYYCSKTCKTKGWNLRHKDECGNMSLSPTQGGRSKRGKSRSGDRDSPTPATDAEHRKKGAEKGKSGDPKGRGKRDGSRTPGSAFKNCPRNPICGSSHLTTSSRLSGRCIKDSLNHYIMDNYSYV